MPPKVSGTFNVRVSFEFRVGKSEREKVKRNRAPVATRLSGKKGGSCLEAYFERRGGNKNEHVAGCKEERKFKKH